MSYFADSWNILDFTIVVAGLVNLLPFEFINLGAFRMFRALRPLRMISRLRGMQLVVTTLIQVSVWV